METLDIFNPQISTVSKGIEGKIILIYGGNNCGKTLQATRMDKPFYLPFERGLNAIQGIPFCPINKWSDFVAINKQLTDSATVDKARQLYSTIILDEVKAAANYCQDYICQTYMSRSIGEGKEGYGLWKEYETEFWKQMNKLMGAGYCVCFIAHATQTQDGFTIPDADKRALAPIVNNTDLTIYVKSNGIDEDGRVIKSSGYLAESKEYFARSKFNYIPTTFMKEFTAENIKKVLIEAIEAQEKAEGFKAVTFEEQKAQYENKEKNYEELMNEMQSLGEMMNDNGFFEDLQSIVVKHLGSDKKATDLKKGQEQQIEVIIYDIQAFLDSKGIKY